MFKPEIQLDEQPRALRILVVDDETMARTLLRLMLVRDGFEVIEAVDGVDALQKLQKDLPSLIVLDVMMPGLDGIEICRRLRQQPETAQLPVLMLSAKTDATSISLGLAAGATRYLKKPIASEELTQQVREVLNG